MIDFLLAVPGKLKTISDHLLTYWTATRAAKVDNLDAAISTRAAASTAVSNADYTAGKAVFLDAAISGRLGSIKNIYAGEVTIANGNTTGTATITAVVLARTILLFNGSRVDFASGSNEGADWFATIALTATTTITATRNHNGQALRIGYMVVEFNA